MTGSKTRRAVGVNWVVRVFVCVFVGVAALEPARAFDFFGLFGDADGPPDPTPATLPYDVTFEISGDDDVERALKDASKLYDLRSDAPPDGDILARRIEADIGPLTDALWGAGFYGARVAIEVDGASATVQRVDRASLARAAEAYRGSAVVPVRVVVETGEVYRLRSVAVLDAASGAPYGEEELPSWIIGLEPGEPGRASDLRAAQARMVDHWRGRARPFADVTSIRPTVYHDDRVMDVVYEVSPGPAAGFGQVTVSGTENVDPRVVSSFIYLEPGEPYSPRRLDDTRKSVQRIEALSSVRIREAEALDAQGNLPLDVEVSERPPRLFGFAARYSTTDGPALRTYWAHRNLFGGAERIRFDAEIGYPTLRDSGFGDFDLDGIAGKLGASFLKPALYGTRNDLLIDGTIAREVTEDYTSRFASGRVAIRHRFTERFSVQAGVEAERGQSRDVLGTLDYLLVGVPLSLTYDSTDNLLDPTEGIRATASLTPYLDLVGPSDGFVQAKAQLSTYYALDRRKRYVLAGRIGFGSIVGAETDEIPANRRFFAGGGGSVRGYTYRSLSPLLPGTDDAIGGRSMVEGSLEARIKVTDTIGVVPFIDAGTAFSSEFPDFDEDIRFAAGVGLRYYTGIGPIRLDVAFPLNRRRRDSSFALYVGFGQAF